MALKTEPHGRSAGPVSAAAARAGLAFVVAAGTFVWFRFRYYDSCVFPIDGVGTMLVFWLYPLVFLAAFVALVSELTLIALTAGRASVTMRVVSIGVGLLVYAAVAGVAWTQDPVPVNVEGEIGYRATYSALWPIGFLQETGNFSDYSCDY